MNPPLMRQACWAGVICTHFFVCVPIGVLASAISPLLAPPAVSATEVRQALQRLSGPQLLAYWLQSDNLPDPEFTDCNQGLAFDRALSHAVGQHRERVEPPKSVDMT